MHAINQTTKRQPTKRQHPPSTLPLRHTVLRPSRRGSVGKTAFGLLTLGCVSAVFGALVVGPFLGSQLEPASAESRSAPTSPPAEPAGERLASSVTPEEPIATKEPDDTDSKPVSDADLPVSERAAREGWDEPDLPEPAPDPAPEPAPETKTQASRPTRTETDTLAEPRPEIERPSRGRSRDEEPRSEPRAKEPAISSTPEQAPRRARSERERRAPSREDGTTRIAREEPRKAEEPRPVKREEPTATTKVEPEPTSEPEKVFRVRTGRFTSREDADKARAEIAATGATASIVPVGDGFRIQLGAFKQRANAEKAASLLKSTPYRPEIQESAKN